MELRPSPRPVLLAAILGAALYSSAGAAGKQHAPSSSPLVPIAPALSAAPAFSAAPAVALELQSGYLNSAVPGLDAQQAARVIAVLTSRDGAQVPYEQQRAMAGELFNESKRTGSVDEGAAVPGEASSSSEPLSAGRGSDGPSEPGQPPEPSPKAKGRPSRRQRAADWLTYQKHFFGQMWWYTVTHIHHMWPASGDPKRPGYQDKIAAGRARGELPLASHREFFAHMRVMGLTGRFYILGYTPLKDERVVREAKETFDAYFTHPKVGAAERAAFHRFIDRARNYNTARRNKTNFRKHLRDALLAAAVKPIPEIAPFFDSLLKEHVKLQTEGFQASGGHQLILDGFRDTMMRTLAEENKASKSRIVAAILIGSFASGGATMTSDFDVEAVSADGSNRDLKAFMRRLEDNWQARMIVIDGKPVSAHAQHPVTVHDNAVPPSRGVLDSILSTDYIVYSHDPALVARLALAPGQAPALKTSQEMRYSDRLARAAQYAIVYATTVYADFEADKPRLD